MLVFTIPQEETSLAYLPDRLCVVYLELSLHVHVFTATATVMWLGATTAWLVPGRHAANYLSRPGTRVSAALCIDSHRCPRTSPFLSQEA